MPPRSPARSAAALVVAVALSGCASTPAASEVCGDAVATAAVWDDLNGNGRHEENEPGLPDICIDVTLAGEPHPKNADTRCTRTDENGNWSSSGFVAGYCGTPEQAQAEIAAQCRQVSIAVFPPPDYVTTTATSVQGCSAEFGLVRTTTP